MRQVVFLYNDKDKDDVRAVWHELRNLRVDLDPWFSAEQIGAFGTLFELIIERIESADAVVFFVGKHGLGKFQQNIELGALFLERWQRGKNFGCIVVALTEDTELPRQLLSFPSISHPHVADPKTLAERIAQLLDAKAGTT